MKCPKCGYLGFEHVERCRNCGYDFSMSPSAALPDLEIRHESTSVNPLDDFTLADDSSAAIDSDPFIPEADTDLDRVLAAPSPAGQMAALRPLESARVPAASEPTLFDPLTPDDLPLITKASPPRVPLAVRRATPETPRLRTDSPKAASLDLPLDLDLPDIVRRPIVPPGDRVEAFEPAYPLGGEGGATASVLSRGLAVAVDLLILAAIDAVVVYFTMQICGVGLDDLAILPKRPLLAFLLVQNVGYVVTFTAGGQTLGKMAAGIKVVAADERAPLDFGRALLRTLAWFVLAMPAGLGFLSLIFSRDHRGLHDRFARTRVVRASA
jgi:uncharacterized RDD family membrane protein YckC